MERNDKWTAWYNIWRKQIIGGLKEVIDSKFEGGAPFDANGEDFESQFKKFHSEGPEEESKAETPKAAPKPAPKKPTAVEKKKREPIKKVVKNNLIEACFYEGETLTFEGDDVGINSAVSFIRSEKTNFIVSGKIKVVNIEGCKNCAVVLDDVITQIELMNCEGMKVQIKGKAMQFIVDRCKNTQLYLDTSGKGIKVHTTNSTTTVLNFPAEEVDENGNDSRSIPVYETWETVIKEDKLQCKPFELDV